MKGCASAGITERGSSKELSLVLDLIALQGGQGLSMIITDNEQCLTPCISSAKAQGYTVTQIQ